MTARRRTSAAVVVALLLLMAAFGDGVYRTLGHFRHLNAAVDIAPADPSTTTAGIRLPGVVLVAQGGDVYALRGTDFHRVLAHDSGGAWMQPAALADGTMVVIDRHEASSDLVHVSADGAVLGVLASGAARKLANGSLEDNHWIFAPHATPDGRALLVAYDSPKQGFLVDFAIWSTVLPGTASASPTPRAGLTPRAAVGLPTTARRLSTPNDYTGGDVDPLPWPAGGILFTRYSIDGMEHVHSQVWWAASASDPGRALTPADRDCAQPALAGDGAHLAMVCSAGQQSTTLIVASVAEATGAGGGGGVATPGAIGASTPSPAASPGPSGRATPPPAHGPVLGAEHPITSGSLAAQPAWSPDGSGLVYLAPAETGSGFQLWWVDRAATASPASPVQVTSALGLDATSRPLWTAG